MQISNGATLGTTRTARFHFVKTLSVFLPLGRILNLYTGECSCFEVLLWGPLASFNDPRTKKRAKASLVQLTCLHYSITNRERRCHAVNRVRLHEAATRNSPGLNQAWLTIQPRTKSEDHSIDGPRHWRYKFFSSRFEYCKFAVKPPLGMKRCKNRHGSSRQWKRLQLCPASNVWGDNSFPPFTAIKRTQRTCALVLTNTRFSECPKTV